MFREYGNKPKLGASVKTTNPTTSDVLADTGALRYGLHEVRIVVGASVAATFIVQRRNAANDGNVGDTVTLYTAAGQSGQFVLGYSVEAGERVRVLAEANITGTAAAAINVEQLT